MNEQQQVTLVEQLAAIQVALQLFKDQIPQAEWENTNLPIIAAPRAWLDDVAKFMQWEPGQTPGEMYNCQVVEEPNVEEPVLIRHDGKIYKISSFLEQKLASGPVNIVLPEKVH